jgi:hypothetical protein
VQQVEPVPLVSLDKQGAALHGVIFPLPRSGCHSLPDVYWCLPLILKKNLSGVSLTLG